MSDSASSGAIRAGGAFVELFTTDAKFVKGLQRVEAKFKAWGKGMREIGRKAFEAGSLMGFPLLAAAEVFREVGTDLYEMSQRTGVAVESLSALRYAAQQTGLSGEVMEKALLKMTRTIEGAREKGGAAAGTLAKLGLTVSDLAGLSADEQLGKIADALGRMNAGAQNLAAFEIFGRSYAELLPLLKEGSAGIAAFTARAKELGIIVSTQDAKAAHEFTKKLIDLWDVLKMVNFAIGGQLAPILTGLSKTIANDGAIVMNFIRAHRTLTLALGATAIGLVVVGGALVGLGYGFSFVGAALGVVAKLITTTFGVFSTVVAAAFTPLGLLTLGIAGVIAALLAFTNVGGAVKTYIVGVFQDLKKDVTTALGGIADALAAGDFALAAQIAWTLVRLEVAKAVNIIKEMWAELKFAGMELWSGLSAGILSTWAVVKEYLSDWSGVKAAAEKILTWLKKSFQNIGHEIFDALEDVFTRWRDNQVPMISHAAAVARKNIDAQEKAGTITHEQADKGRQDIAGSSVQALQEEKDFEGTYQANSRRQRNTGESSQYRDAQASIDQEFAKANPGLVASTAAALAKIKEAREKAKTEHEAELKQKIGETTDAKEVKALQKQLAELRTQAHTEATTPENEKEKPKPPGVEAYASKTAGTFSGEALFGLGGGGATADKIAQNTAKSAAGIDQMNKVLNKMSQSGGLVWQ